VYSSCLKVVSIADWDFFQLSHAREGFGGLYRKEKRRAEREAETAQLLDSAFEQNRETNLFVHSQALLIDELRAQVSTLCGEPVPPSVLLSTSTGSENELADDEEEVEEEAEVRTLVGAPEFQEVVGLGSLLLWRKKRAFACGQVFHYPATGGWVPPQLHTSSLDPGVDLRTTGGEPS
jgi:hypothetical protein